MSAAIDPWARFNLEPPAPEPTRADPWARFNLEAPPSAGASTRAEFVRQMLPLAQAAAERTGIDPVLLVAQAVHESNWGRSVANNNLFGIKAGSDYEGNVAPVATHEYINGQNVAQTDQFRAYGSPEESFNDYASVISNNQRYRNVIGSGTDATRFATGLQQGGYATDPDYASKLMKIANVVRQIAAASQSGIQPVPAAPTTPRVSAPPASTPMRDAGYEPDSYMSALGDRSREFLVDPFVRGYRQTAQASNPLSLGLGIEDPYEAAKDIATRQGQLNAMPVADYRAAADARAQEIMAAAPPEEPDDPRSMLSHVLTAGSPLGMLYDNAPQMNRVVPLLKVMGAYLKDPRAAVNLTLESAAASASSLAAGMGGGLAGGTATGGPVGAAIGAALGAGGASFATEYGSDIINTLAERNVDLTNEDAVYAALTNPEFMAQARSHAVKRGAGVALFDALSAGIGGRVAKPIERAVSSAGKTAAKAAPAVGELGEVFAQGTAGGAGEAAGSVAAGDDVNLAAVAQEFIGEGLSGGVEATSGRYVDARNAKADKAAALERALIDAASGHASAQHGARLEPEAIRQTVPTTRAPPLPSAATIAPPAQPVATGGSGSPAPVAEETRVAPESTSQGTAPTPTAPEATAPAATAPPRIVRYLRNPDGSRVVNYSDGSTQILAPDAPEPSLTPKVVPPAADKPAPPVSTPTPAPPAGTVATGTQAAAGGATALKARLKEVMDRMRPYTEKGDLTGKEAAEFRQLVRERAEIAFQLDKPATDESLAKGKNTMSTLSAPVVKAATTDILKNRAAYMAFADHSAGTQHSAHTPLDDIMEGKNPDVTAAELYDAFAPTREALRAQYGDTVKLYRAVGQQKDKAVTNWATTREFAAQFGDKVIERDVPIEDIVAVRANRTGTYHELVVGKPPKASAPALPKSVPKRETGPKRSQKVGQPEHDSILEYMSKTRLGDAQSAGLSIDAMKAEGLDPAEMKSAKGHGIRKPFTKQGATSLDQWAEHLSEMGYPVLDEDGRYSANKLLDMIVRELRGGHRYTGGSGSTPAGAAAAEAKYADQETQLAVDLAASAEDTGATVDEAKLVAMAVAIDEDAVERAAKEFENDDAGFRKAVRAIIAGNGQSPTHAPRGETASPDEADSQASGTGGAGTGQEAGFQLTPTAAQETAGQVKTAVPQGDMFGKNQAAQDLADEQRKKDKARSPGTDVDPGAPGGLFSSENKQPELYPRAPTGGDQVTPQPYASGLSAKTDLPAGINAKMGVGVVIKELSEESMTKVATAAANGKEVFVDSGAFSAFQIAKKQKRKQKAADFDKVMTKMQRLVDMVKAQTTYAQRGFVQLVAPDMVGEQAASLELLRQHAEQVQGWIDDGFEVIVPFQRGPLKQSEVYKEVVDILDGTDFVVGIPSNAAAMSPDDFHELLRQPYKPDRLHILGAINHKRLEERMQIIREEYKDDVPGVTADANLLRAKMDQVVGLSGQDRTDAISKIIADEEQRQQAKREQTKQRLAGEDVTDVTDDEEEVTELDDDIGAAAAEEGHDPDEMEEDFEPEEGAGVEASMPESEASSRNNKRTEKVTLPSTPRETLMVALGIDPTSFRLKGGLEQFKIVRKALMDRYGFKSIAKHPSQNWRNAVDHMLDGFESLQNMAAALGTSAREISLKGKIGLQFQRNTKARGLFIYPHSLISIFDQSDVYAHEYGHAVDYHLMEEAGAMQPGGLSAMIRKRQGTASLPESVGQAYADLMTALYYDAAHIAQAIKQAEHQLEKAEAPKRRAQLEKRLENLRSGAWRGRGGQTQFYQRAKNGPMASYLRKPTELVARSFEAYLSAKIQQQKALGLVKFLGATDAIYSDKADAWMQRIYPQDSDRAQIFAAWDNLIGAMTREGLYDTSQPVGYADGKLNLGLMDPVAQAKAAGLPITPDLVKAKNLTNEAAKTYLEDEAKRRDTVRNNLRALRQGLKDGTGNTLANLNALMRTCGGTPDGVFAYLERRFPHIKGIRTIRDNLSDAQIHGRDKSVGIYREIARTEAQLVTEVTGRLRTAGIQPNMDKAWTARMWDLMHGYATPKDATEKLQADRLRYEYDRLFKLRDQNGARIGYTSEPYMNRITHPEVVDDTKYQAALLQLRTEEKQALLDKLRDQLKNAKSEEEKAELEAKIKKTDAIDPKAETLYQIKAMKGLEWGAPVTLGALNEDSAKARVFGPLADKILKDWYIQDPVELLSVYAASTAREMVMRRRLGKNPNATIDGWLLDVAKDLPKAYSGLLLHSMQMSMGMQTIKASLPGTQVLSAYAAISNAQMLGRAAIPNFSEPLGVLGKTFTPIKTLGDLIQAGVPLLRSQSKKNRYKSADRFGRLAGVLVDAAQAMTAQAQVTGDDTQGKGLVSRFSQKAYTFNLITPLTSRQEKVINRLGLELFYDAAESIRTGDEDAALYSQWLREHGITNPAVFANFLRGANSVDSLTFEDTLSGHGLQLANALDHFVKTTIQKPTPSTKLLLSNRGNFGLIFRLTSWMTTNYRNWAVPNTRRIQSAFTGKYGDVNLTVKQRLGAMVAPVASTMISMYAAQALFVVARMLLTNSDEWDKRGEGFWDRFWSAKTQSQIFQYWGTLGWLASTAIDVVGGTRHNRGVFATLAGPVYGPLVQDVERFITYFTKNSDKTNTGERNVAEAGWHLLSMLITFGGVSALPATPWWARALGFMWSFYGTSPQMSRHVATLAAGPEEKKTSSPLKAVDKKLRERTKPVNDKIRKAIGDIP